MARQLDGPIREFRGRYKFLSNFYRSPIEMGSGDRGSGSFPSAEHAFQAAKPLLADDREAIRLAATPAKAKQLGRECASIRLDWEKVRLAIMEEVLRAKFESGSVLTQQLLETGDRELIEGNWWGDYYWGVCNGRGENHLGKILMRIRAELAGKRKYKAPVKRRPQSDPSSPAVPPPSYHRD